jgi:hypothetical protein
MKLTDNAWIDRAQRVKMRIRYILAGFGLLGAVISFAMLREGKSILASAPDEEIEIRNGLRHLAGIGDVLLAGDDVIVAMQRGPEGTLREVSVLYFEKIADEQVPGTLLTQFRMIWPLVVGERPQVMYTGSPMDFRAAQMTITHMDRNSDGRFEQRIILENAGLENMTHRTEIKVNDRWIDATIRRVTDDGDVTAETAEGRFRFETDIGRWRIVNSEDESES